MKILIFVSLGVLSLLAAEKPVSIRIEPAERTLRGEGSSQQLLVMGRYADGLERDLTPEVQWRLSDPELGLIDSGGRLAARKNGSLSLTATVDGQSARSTVRIEEVDTARPFEFSIDIGNILTRQGCNGSGCHGGVKGRGGFKLSPGVLNPKDDYEWIVKGGGYQVLTAEVKGERVPRVNVNDPAKSLILLKATLSIPHGGGKRFPVGSAPYQTLLKWIKDGAPYGPEGARENRVVKLEVFPPVVTLEHGGEQRLLITARFADGRLEDFTGQALCIANDKSVAAVSGCVVKSGRLGETSVLVRAAGVAASATVGVIGPPLASVAKQAEFNYIDQFVFDKLRRFRIPPSALSSDEEFLRRVCLDLTGTLPPPARVREFLTSHDPGKRARLIDTLMASPEYVDYWTYRFDDLYRVGVFPNGINVKWSQMYANWIRESIASNKPYNEMARERIAAQGYNGPSRHYLPYDVIGPAGETMAEEVRVFFGRRLDCAQCHNHPYEAWSQDQFWGLAAFYSRMFKMGDTGAEYVIFDHPVNEPMGNGDVNGSIKLVHPRSKAELKPALLDGTVIPPADRVNPRKALADWMVSHPYFAEAAANRIWSYFFGRGLVDPVDDFRSTNPPSHPELLERLAADFRTHGYDLRQLIKTIVLSRTYQLTGQPLDGNREDAMNYSHANPRPLDAEVILDAISSVTGVPEVFSTGLAGMEKTNGRAPAGTRAITLRQPDLYYSRFLDIYGRPNRLTLPERNGKANLGEALHMLAGSAYQEKLGAPGSRLRRFVERAAVGSGDRRGFLSGGFRAVPRRGRTRYDEEVDRVPREARRGPAGFCVGGTLFARICGESLARRLHFVNPNRHPNCCRRDFLKAGSLGFLGINLAQFLRAASTSGAAGKAQSCILLWLEGGPSQVDTWDPKPSSAFKPISSNVPGIQVSELLPQVAKRMDKMSIVRSMHTMGSDHPQGTHYAITGHEVNPAMHFPSLGSIIAKETGPRNGVPAHVLTPQWEKARQYEEYFRSGFLGPEVDPMAVPDPSAPGFEVADLSLPKSLSGSAVEGRQTFLKAVDHHYRTAYAGAEHASMDGFTAQAWKMLLNPSVRNAFDLSKEPDQLKDRYGRDSFGQSALLARRLVESGSRFVTAAGFHSNSWDTHAKNDAGHRDRLCPVLDRTLAALLDDLDGRGLLESTVVLAMGEFGRTPFVNPDLGRDHWPTCWSLAIGGGGIQGGRVVGSSDETGAKITSRATSMGDVFATIYKAFGIDWTKEYDTPIGRPIKIANSLDDQTGSPIAELL